jgi:hypothetical protein
MAEDDVPKHVPRNRATAGSKLRRSRKHCPVCVEPLRKNATRTKLMAKCEGCGANPQPGKQCSRCRAESIWQGRAGAACQSCGHRGKAADVIAS